MVTEARDGKSSLFTGLNQCCSAMLVCKTLMGPYTYPCSTSTSLPFTVNLTIFGGSGAGVAWLRSVVVENAAARNIAADILDDEPVITRERGIVVAALNEPSIVVTVFRKCENACWPPNVARLLLSRVLPTNHMRLIKTHMNIIT